MYNKYDHVSNIFPVAENVASWYKHPRIFILSIFTMSDVIMP